MLWQWQSQFQQRNQYCSCPEEQRERAANDCHHPKAVRKSQKRAGKLQSMIG